jgi:hypothetical protein
MFSRKTLHILCGVVLLGVLATSTTGAMPSAKRTTYFTFNKPVALPGVSLSAGTYIFELADPNQDMNLVRVLSRDRNKVYLTAFTQPVERPRSNKMDAAILLGEASPTNPPPIKAWYPHGERTGHLFNY